MNSLLECEREKWFDMQAKELVKSVACSVENDKLQGALKNIKKLVEAIPHSTASLEDAFHAGKEEGIDFVMPKKETWDRVSVSFEGIENAAVVGSWILKTCCKPSMNVDLVFEIPTSVFKSKEHLNYRWDHHVRYYLLCILQSLKSSFNASFDAEKKIILIKDEEWNGFCIQIFVSLPEGIFEVEKLSPSKVNVKSEYYENHKDLQYNNEILKASSFKQQLAAMHNFISENEEKVLSFILLLKHWMNQHGNLLNSFELNALICYAHEKGILNASMSPYSLFRAIMFHLSSMKCGVYKTSAGLDEDGFKAAFEISLLDSTGHINMWSRVSKNDLNFLSHDAKKTIELLDKSDKSSFEQIFLMKRRAELRFDFVLSIKGASKKEIEDSIEFAFADRVDQFLVMKTCDSFLAGLCLSPTAFKAVSIGPTANTPMATKFRQFWGEKSELRKFKSGLIHECVSFESLLKSKSAEDRSIIINEISRFIGLKFKWHISVVKEIYALEDAHPLSNLEEYEQLCKIMKKMDLALNISSILPLSPHFRHTNLTSKLRCLPVLESLIKLESSTEWPSDHEAIEASVILFYNEFKQAFLSLEYSVLASKDYIDVLSPKGNRIYRFMIEVPSMQNKYYSPLDLNLIAFTALFKHIPSFASACKLFKRWLKTHMLYPIHINDVTAELLVIAAMDGFYSFSLPQADGSVRVAYGTCGTILERVWSLIAEWDWSIFPLVLCAEAVNTIAPSEITVPTFILAMPSNCIEYKVDIPAAIWTRLVVLSKKCCQHLPLSINSFFKPSLKDFDHILQLESEEKVDFTGLDAELAISIRGHDCIKHYVALIEKMYKQDVYVFWNNEKIMALKWKNSEEWECKLREIVLIGNGLIVKIEANK